MTARNLPDSSLKAAISVSEMARIVSLSRNHFWALCKRGVFPMPVYGIANRRPFYDLEAQQSCLRVRETNIGHDGQYVMFYAPRQDEAAPVSSRPKVSGRFVDLAKALKHLGLEVTSQQIEAASKNLFPQGLPSEDGHAIRALFTHFRRSQSQ